jgi:hypothetical protein
MALKHAGRDVFTFFGTTAGMAALGAGIYLAFNQPCVDAQSLTCIGSGWREADFLRNWGFLSPVLGVLAGWASESLGEGSSEPGVFD